MATKDDKREHAKRCEAITLLRYLETTDEPDPEVCARIAPSFAPLAPETKSKSKAKKGDS